MVFGSCVLAGSPLCAANGKPDYLFSPVPCFPLGNTRLVPVLPTYREGIDFVPRFYCLSPALGCREMVLDKGLVFPLFGDIYYPVLMEHEIFLFSWMPMMPLGARSIFRSPEKRFSKIDCYLLPPVVQ